MGSVPPGHVSIRSRPCVRWPDPAAAILGVLAAASFVTRPRGTAWQGACGRGWVSPLPLGAQRELRLLELRNCQAAGWQGPQGPGHGRGLLISETQGVPAAGTRARVPARARAPPPGSPRVSHPSRPRPPAATHRSPWAAARRCSQNQLGTASVATGRASPATAVPRAAAARSAPSERVPAQSPEAGLGGPRARAGGPGPAPESPGSPPRLPGVQARSPMPALLLLAPRPASCVHRDLPSSSPRGCGALLRPTLWCLFGFP